MTEEKAKDDLAFRVGDNAAGQLVGIVQRIERMNEEIAALTEDRKEIFEEAKVNGFDTKIIRKLIALRKMDTADRQEMEAILDLYKTALGMR
jgi:hypothetical protein